MEFNKDIQRVFFPMNLPINRYMFTIPKWSQMDGLLWLNFQRCLDTSWPSARHSTFSPEGLAFDASYASDPVNLPIHVMHKSNQQPQHARENPLGGCRLEWIPSMVNWIYPENYITLTPQLDLPKNIETLPKKMGSESKSGFKHENGWKWWLFPNF